MEAIKTQDTRVGLALRLAIAAVACAMAIVAMAFVQVAHADDPHADDPHVMHRLYNPNSGEHLYTADTVEKNAVVDAGWNYEGGGWVAPTTGDPVYRLYNPVAGEHHYTMSTNECKSLERAGWINEGEKWKSNTDKEIVLHRLYNPNEFANNHHYTTSDEERAELERQGWKYEGESWYGWGNFAAIAMKDYGTITVLLDDKAAPKTVANFKKLANEGFYNGLTFHRIMPGWMMQGGDPRGNGYGGSSEQIYGEFASNGWEGNYLSHTRGTISMARATDPNSASSQFFIMHQDDDNDPDYALDGRYAAFGHVIDGIEVVDAICGDARPIDLNGTIADDKKPVINSIKIGKY